jgi:hypothetical protein
METRALKGPTDYRTINMVARTLDKYYHHHNDGTIGAAWLDCNGTVLGIHVLQRDTRTQTGRQMI